MLQVTLRAQNVKADPIAPYSRSYQRVEVNSILNAPEGGLEMVGKTLRVGGWVRTGREAGAGAFAFLEVYDGSCFESLQCMITAEVASDYSSLGLKAFTATGSSVLLEGELVKTPEGTKQLVELKVTMGGIKHVGPCDATVYPMAKKKQSMEFLRTKIHLRPRTNFIGAVARIRHALSYATHAFFNQQGFKYVHTPIITASDCEGAGEMFQVTTLMSDLEAKSQVPPPTPADVAAAQAEVAEGETTVADLKAKAEGGDKEAKKGLKKAAAALEKAKLSAAAVAKAFRARGGLSYTEDGTVDYRDDFFGKQAFLTVSGQLEGEQYACALSSIYTFGPTFRAENSNTTRHLAEFWMIEPEMAFCDLEDDMQCAEDYVRFCAKHVLATCARDLAFVQQYVDPECINRLEQVASSPFKRCSYTEAIELLTEVVKSKKKKFEYPVEWGIDLQSEHERYLTEEIFKAPTIVYNYPKAIKAFYMRENDDGKTCAAMDVLVPKVGELIGGSQREDRLDVLERKIKEQGMELSQYEHYLDLRRFGTVPHAGFGLGFERLIMFATGIENIRDVIPFPRWPQHAT